MSSWIKLNYNKNTGPYRVCCATYISSKNIYLSFHIFVCIWINVTKYLIPDHKMSLSKINIYQYSAYWRWNLRISPLPLQILSMLLCGKNTTVNDSVCTISFDIMHFRLYFTFALSWHLTCLCSCKICMFYHRRARLIYNGEGKDKPIYWQIFLSVLGYTSGK